VDFPLTLTLLCVVSRLNTKEHLPACKAVFNIKPSMKAALWNADLIGQPAIRDHFLKNVTSYSFGIIKCAPQTLLRGSNTSRLTRARTWSRKPIPGISNLPSLVLSHIMRLSIYKSVCDPLIAWPPLLSRASSPCDSISYQTPPVN